MSEFRANLIYRVLQIIREIGGLRIAGLYQAIQVPFQGRKQAAYVSV